jgi:hypothetical protein
MIRPFELLDIGAGKIYTLPRLGFIRVRGKDV